MKSPSSAENLPLKPSWSPEPPVCPAPPLSGCSLRELEAQITELAGQLNAANYRWLTLIGEFDRRQGWVDGYRALARRAHRPVRDARR